MNEAALTLRDVVAARACIRDVARYTPLERSDFLSSTAGTDVLLKLECWQPTRSFKVRGAYNAIATLGEDARARGLVTASAGNHGQAVALAARSLGARALIYVPDSAPATKRERISALGATLCDGGADYDEAERRAVAHADRDGLTFVHAFSDPAVVAGQGTVALEVLEQCPQLRTVLVPVGGGGLIGGMGLVLKTSAPDIRVVGVQSTQTRAMYEALRAGRVVDVPVPPTLADGLAGCTDEPAYRLARRVVDDIVLVEEAEIAEAMRVLYRHCGVVAEGSGAVGVAALCSGRVHIHGPAAIVITGSNIDSDRLSAVLSGTLAS